MEESGEGPQVETIDDAASHRPMLRWLSLVAQDHWLRNITTHSGLGPPPSINSQDISPSTCPQAILIWVVPSLRFPS